MTVSEYIDFVCVDSFRIVYENKVLFDSNRNRNDVPLYIGESVVQYAYFDGSGSVEIDIG